MDLDNWYQDLLGGTRTPKRTLLIGEIGINHNGDLDLAKRLIEMCKENGCDFVKFQKRTPDVCVPDFKKNELKETPWGAMTYLEYKNKIEFGLEQYLQIDEFCKQINIGWSASAWDIKSQEFISNFNVPFNKIASAMNTNLEFVKRVASERKVTLLSTGMSTIEDIEVCVSIFQEYNCPVILLHTVSTYPAQDAQLNLQIINTLRDKFGLPVGYSGHEPSVSPSIVAASLGAVVIERHVTIDRTMWGTDQSASLEPNGIKQLSEILKRIPVMLGKPDKLFFEAEKKASLNLRYW